MRKITKVINLTLAIIILLSAILPIIPGISEVLAATYEVQYHGKLTYRRIYSR